VAKAMLLMLVAVVAVAMVGAEDHGVQVLDDHAAPAVAADEAAKLKEEVTLLRGKLNTIAATTAADMREKLNQQKEVYYKKMKYAGSYKGKLALATARAATQVAEAAEESGKYKAMVDVLRTKAAYGSGLKKTVAGLQGKMVAAVEATAQLESQIQALKAENAKLKSGHNPEDVAMIAKLKNKLKSSGGNAKAEKEAAKAAHKKAADLHKAAGDEHKQAGDDKAAANAGANAKKAEDAANHPQLKTGDKKPEEMGDDDEEDDEDEDPDDDDADDDDDEEGESGDDKVVKL